MSSRFVNAAGAWPSPRSLPFKWKAISPDDHVELIDCVGILVVGDTQGDLTIRWHDGTLTTLDLSNLHGASRAVGPAWPMLPAFIMDTDTDFGDGELLGAFLQSKTEHPNRSPIFRNASFERTIAPDQASLQGIFRADGFDPDYDALTWSREGTWPSTFSLVLTGANAGRIDYTRSGDLAEGDIALQVGIIDATGVNEEVVQTFTIHVVSA